MKRKDLSDDERKALVKEASLPLANLTGLRVGEVAEVDVSALKAEGPRP